MDARDAVAKRTVLGKTAYRERVRRVMGSIKARSAAIKTLASLPQALQRLHQEEGCSDAGLKLPNCFEHVF